MSEGIPESIPTSQDPRSKRPTKRRALTPVSEQAAMVSSLFAKPDQEIRIAESSSLVKKTGPAPPEIVANVQGSSAGAGSGEFHVYKASRRREYERLRAMDEEVRKEKEDEEFEREKRDREERDKEKTRKNREKRDKKRKAKEKTAEMKKDEGGKGDGQQKLQGIRPREITASNAEEHELMGNVQVIDQTPELGLIIHDDD